MVEVMIALPGQLFFNTQIPACLWFLAKDKTRAVPGGQKAATGAARCCSSTRASWPMNQRVQCVFDDADLRASPGTVHAWRARGEDGRRALRRRAGFCRAVKLAEIAEHGHVLTPGRYVGAEAAEDDDEAFAEKMERLTAQLGEQMAKGRGWKRRLERTCNGLVLRLKSPWENMSLSVERLEIIKQQIVALSRQERAELSRFLA